MFAILFGSSAFAGDLQKITGSESSMTFEDLRAACLNPSQFHNQVAPSNIQISCNDVQFKWISDDVGALSMANGRYIKASLVSDKYTVDTVGATVDISPQVVACPNYRQVSETLETVRSISCDEIVAFVGSATDFCVGAINSMKAINPESIVVLDTGETLSLCGPTPTGTRNTFEFDSSN